MGFDDPVGGVVVDVLPAHLDADTGEIVGTRYRCLDVYRNPGYAWQYLDAGEVDERSLEGVGRQLSTSAAYWLLRQINTNRRVLHPDDARHLHGAHVLGAAIVTP